MLFDRWFAISVPTGASGACARGTAGAAAALLAGLVAVFGPAATEPTTAQPLEQPASPRTFERKSPGMSRNQTAPGLKAEPGSASPVAGLTKAAHDRIVELAGKGNYAGALGGIDQAIATSGRGVALMVMRARLHCQFNRPVDCLKDIDSAVALDVNSAETMLWRARLRSFNMPRTRESEAIALADYAEAERLAPRDASTFYFRGLFYAELNRPERALAEYEQALERNPKSTETHRAKTQLLFERTDFDAAFKSADAAIANEPNDAAPHAIRGLILLARRDVPSARADIDKAVAASGGRFDLYTSLGVTALGAATVIDRNGSVGGGAR